MFSNDKNRKERLSHRVVRGGFWVFSLRIVHRLFSLTRLIILARILAPHDFGLMGIAMLMMAILETFSQTGFQEALIQKKDNVESYLNSAWTVLILRGLILFATLYLIAPYAAIFFKTLEAKSIIRVIGFSILFQAFTNIGIVYFQKELEFNKQFIYQLSGTLADFVVAVFAAFILRSAWALVFGVLAGYFVRCIVSYIIHPYKPHLSLDFGKAKELFGFGRWIFGSSILIFLINQGGDIFVGRLLGVTMLGFYQMAYKISNMPATEIAKVISQVTFPAYSKLQDNLPKLREAYLKVLQLTAFLSFPIAGLIFILAPDFTKIFLGGKWMPMVPAMQVLALWGLIRSLGSSAGSLWQAVGKPYISTYFHIAKFILLASLIYSFTIMWGILGAALAVVAASLSVHFFGYPVIARTIKCNIRTVCHQLFFPLIGTTSMLIALHLTKQLILRQFEITGFFLLVMIGAAVYSLVIYLADRFCNYRLFETLRTYLLMAKD